MEPTPNWPVAASSDLVVSLPSDPLAVMPDLRYVTQVAQVPRLQITLMEDGRLVLTGSREDLSRFRLACAAAGLPITFNEQSFCG